MRKRAADGRFGVGIVASAVGAVRRVGARRNPNSGNVALPPAPRGDWQVEVGEWVTKETSGAHKVSQSR